jgi:hypothetical protein
LKAAAVAAVAAVKTAAPPAAPATVTPPNPQPAPEVKLEAPQGSPLTPQAVENIQAFSKSHGLSQAQGAALLQLQHDSVVQQQERFKATQLGFFAAIRQDPEIGGSDDIVKANLEHAKLGAKQLFTDVDLEHLQKHGLADMPMLIRAGLRAYKVMVQPPDYVDGRPVIPPSKGKEVDSSPKGWQEALYTESGKPKS